MSQTRAGIPNTVNISDDIILGGKDRKEHNEKLIKLLTRLYEDGFTINLPKCLFGVSKLDFYGLVFSEEGMSPDPQKVEDLKNLAVPRNSEELQSLIGMLGFSSRFIPNYSTLTDPLRQLIKKNVKWVWGKDQQRAFEMLKRALQEAPVLAYFDTEKETELIVDASPVGIAGLLAQRDRQGEACVIAYGSRSLTPVEQRYSQTEREALAVVWGCEHFHLYVYGKPIKVFTDHKPLTFIFNNPTSKTSARMERWALRLQPYQPEVVYAPGKDNPADYLSRHPNRSTALSSRQKIVAEEYINFVTDHAAPVAITVDDEVLQRVIECIRNEQWSSLGGSAGSFALRSYKAVKEELCVNREGDIVLRGSRIVVPESLQNRAMDI